MIPPDAVEKFLLAEIRLRESANDYLLPPRAPPMSTAAGAYQFIKATWAMAFAVVFPREPVPPYANLGTADQQDGCALWLLRAYGANSTHAWKASGPYPSPAEIGFALTAIGVIQN